MLIQNLLAGERLMPIFHRIDSETGILHVTRSGSIDTHDEETAFRTRKSDPNIHPGMPVLVDCREVTPPDSTRVVQYLASKVTRLASRLDCGPVGILVSSDVEYGMARMFIALTERVHPHTNVFRNYNEALAWLKKKYIQK
jgi:hypothetical protein